jgi:ERCC4-type nuclease
MAQVEYITIKNASRKVLNKMREIGEKKAQRLRKIQERWDAGDIKDVEVVQL